MTITPMDQLPTDPKLKRGLRTLGLVLALVAVTTATAGIVLRMREHSSVADWTKEQAIPTVGVVRPTVTSSGSEIVLPGTVRAFIDAPIYARVNGYVKRWFVDIGASVRAGQPLAELETPELDQQLLQAEADLATARSNEQLSATTATRWQRMLEADAVSTQEADEKRGDHAAKLTIVKAAEANVARLRATAAFKSIVAPFGGVVTARKIDIGALVNAGAGSGQELFRLADAHRVRIYADVPQPYAPFIRKGGMANLEIHERPELSVTATITDTSRAINESSRTMLVELETDNTANALLPGSYVDVHFQIPKHAGALRLPVSALIFRQRGLQVATVDSAYKVHLKHLDIGRDFGTEVEVVSGVTGTDQIIDSPPDSLSEGDPVHIAAEGRPGAGS